MAFLWVPLLYDTTLSNGVRRAHEFVWIRFQWQLRILAFDLCLLYVRGINAVVTCCEYAFAADKQPFFYAYVFLTA